MTTAADVSGIVLAGGRSRRFGGDKLDALVDGRRILERAVDAVAAVAGEVVVVVGHDGPAPRVPSDAGVGRIVIVRDALPDGGPLAGLAAGLVAASTPLAIVVAGDQPHLRPAVLAALVGRLADPAVSPVLDVVVLEADPPFRSVPAALRVAVARPSAVAALAGSRRSLVAAYEPLRVGSLPAAVWRPLDPDGASLRDVDRPEDLGAG